MRFRSSLLLSLALLLAPRFLLRAAAGQALVEVDGERVKRVFGGLGLEVVAALLREVASALLLVLALAVACFEIFEENGPTAIRGKKEKERATNQRQARERGWGGGGDG